MPIILGFWFNILWVLYGSARASSLFFYFLDLCLASYRQRGRQLWMGIHASAEAWFTANSVGPKLLLENSKVQILVYFNKIKVLANKTLAKKLMIISSNVNNIINVLKITIKWSIIHENAFIYQKTLYLQFLHTFNFIQFIDK